MIFNPESRRRFLWRAGRYLYCRARGEVANAIETNGEAYVQACVIKGTQSSEIPLTVFDIGANLGKWTTSLLAQIPEERAGQARITMFEPVPSTYEKLLKNMKGLEHGGMAKAWPLAMSNGEGEAEMVILSESGGTNSLEFDHELARQALNKVKIRKDTVDHFCQQEKIDHIHLLKCDTEGHDAHALEGVRAMLTGEQVDVAQFEYNQRWIYARSYLKDVFDLIDGLPYSVGRIQPGMIEVFESWHFELERFFEGNYLIVHDRALDWFNIRKGRFDSSNTYA